MPANLRRRQQSRQSHVVTFSCYRRHPNFTDGAVYDLFLISLEAMRRRFVLRVHGYVVMNAFRDMGVVETESEWTASDRELAAKGGAARVFLLPGSRPKEGREPWGTRQAHIFIGVKP